MPETALSKSKIILGDRTAPKIQEASQDLSGYVTSLIAANICSTISIKQEGTTVYVTSALSMDIKLRTFRDYSQNAYKDFCQDTLLIDLNEPYNSSVTAEICGIRTRIFALMPPLVKTPVITISTTKTPPDRMFQDCLSEDAWNKIAHSNFIIVGPSGSGKTYLMNFLLNRFIGKNERLALIEEFGEIIPPNDLTICISAPPPKPGERHLLEFITQQTNLMRLDMTVIGEIKGEEAWPFILQGASGTRIASTVHGESMLQAMSRLRALCTSSCGNPDVIDEFIAKGLKYVITMKKKRIVSVEELVGTHSHGNFASRNLYSEQ